MASAGLGCCCFRASPRTPRTTRRKSSCEKEISARSTTGQAIQDLDAIAGYIARDSWLRGSQFVADALNRAESLARFPERGRMVPEFSIESIHEIYLHRFRLIYRVDT